MARLLCLVIVCVFCVSACEQEEGPLQAIECDACDGDCLIEQYAVRSASHVSGGLDYENRPPVGGDHDPCWASYGVHETEVPDENWVHNLEHGAIVFLYSCPDGCEEDVAVLESVAAQGTPDTSLVTPYSEMPAGFAAVSWAWRIQLGCADEAALLEFYEEHLDQAPESTTAAPGAGCME